jgi:hypothetical protein
VFRSGKTRPFRANFPWTAKTGDSMIDEKINDNDIVIFRKYQAEDNAIYVVSLGTKLLVKRVQFDELKKTVTLINANAAYAPRKVSGHDLETFKIEGGVITCYHRLGTPQEPSRSPGGVKPLKWVFHPPIAGKCLDIFPLL